MLERAKDTTREGQYTFVEYARFADDLVILMDSFRRHDWLLRAVEKRLREEVAKLGVEMNEEKSRLVELAKGESFGFLGFDFRRIQSRRGVWRPHYTPKLKRRTAVVRKLKEVFRRGHSQPVARIVKVITPILRGWVNYFRIGYSGGCFAFIRQWVETKIRRHVRRAKKRPGFGWKKENLRWVYEELGLFNDYRIHRPLLPQKAPLGR
jgi:RNA-directed DNA polymerase